MHKDGFFRKQEKDITGTRYIYAKIANNTLTVCEVFVKDSKNITETSLGFRLIAINEETEKIVNNIISSSESIEEEEFVEDLNHFLDEYLHTARVIVSKTKSIENNIQ